MPQILCINMDFYVFNPSNFLIRDKKKMPQK